jgi:hypothetical protein
VALHLGIRWRASRSGSKGTLFMGLPLHPTSQRGGGNCSTSRMGQAAAAAGPSHRHSSSAVPGRTSSVKLKLSRRGQRWCDTEHGRAELQGGHGTTAERLRQQLEQLFWHEHLGLAPLPTHTFLVSLRVQQRCLRENYVFVVEEHCFGQQGEGFARMTRSSCSSEVLIAPQLFSDK